MDYTENKVKTLNGYRGVIVNVDLDKITLPDGSEALREVVSHPGGVSILALDSENRVVCVRQYRYCFGEHLLEIPAGKLEYGEDPMECAVRELSEETGISADEFISLGEIYPSPGFCREVLHLYLAMGLHEGEAHPDEGEFLDVLRVPFEELLEKAMSGEIRDGKTVAAILKTKIYLEGRK
ncbi:MAG: NUDIX hydrolase [Candidatus Heteroscillospira sp.]